VAAFCRVRAQSVATDIQNFVSNTAGYNLVTLGNATFNGSSDTQGAIAVGGNLSVGGTYTFASTYGLSNNPTLYVKGTESFTGLSQLQNGYASLPGATGGNWSWSSGSETLSYSGSSVLHMETNGTQEQANPASNAAPTGIDWATSGTSSFAGISSSLASQTATGTISVSSGNLTFSTTQTSGVVIFDLDASQLGSSVNGGVTDYTNTYGGTSFTNVQINVPAGVDYVINVTNLASNSDLFSSGGVNFNSGTNDNQLLWNFNETGSVTLNMGGNLYGSVLAPNENITDNTTIDGQVVAQSFTDTGVELHDDDSFTSVLVPESGAFAWWGLGVCGFAAAVGGGLRRLRRRAQARAALVPLASRVSK
jgi:choice-of-anchor A domain-containing protein